MTSTQVPTRFDEVELAQLDQLVAEGIAGSRSEMIRLAVAEVHDAHRRRRIGQSIADAYRATPQSSADDELAMANAVMLTEAEPW